MAYHLQDFGSYTVGGRILEVTEGERRRVQFTRTVAYDVDPRGHFAIEHAYVQFFVPANRNSEAPVVLVHGGGMSGTCWDTTPDGRPGWLHLLLDRGYEVHVVDAPERGRAGFAPGIWDGQPMLRSMEEAWTLFRIGPDGGFASGETYPGQRFPVEAFEPFARSFVPRWLSTTPLHVAGLLAVLERTGPAIVICHSQGGEVTFDAHAEKPSAFVKIIALEPSGYPDKPEALNGTDVHILAGDFLDTSEAWTQRAAAWRGLGARHSDCPGNTHVLMSDLNSAEIFERALG